MPKYPRIISWCPTGDTLPARFGQGKVSAMVADSSHISISSSTEAPPLAVEVTRGDMIESRHRASYAIVDAAGRMVAAAGNTDAPVYPRSAIKPLQALPVIETGAADRFAMTGPELALACASHGGEPEHVATAAGVLARAGLSVSDLACGPHLPLSRSLRARPDPRGRGTDRPSQ
jgi:L-asparaginase II